MRVLLLTCMIALGCSSTMAKPQKAEKEASALSSANEWLKHVDKEEYQKCWEEASSYFKFSGERG
jgi:hypothetical protein